MAELLKYPHKTDYMTDSVGWENTQHSLERGRDSQHLVSQMVSVHKLDDPYPLCRILMLHIVKAST